MKTKITFSVIASVAKQSAFLCAAFLILLSSCKKEDEKQDVYGCMDPASLNYNPEATVSDGSCQYSVFYKLMGQWDWYKTIVETYNLSGDLVSTGTNNHTNAWFKFTSDSMLEVKPQTGATEKHPFHLENGDDTIVTGTTGQDEYDITDLNSSQLTLYFTVNMGSSGYQLLILYFDKN